MLCLQMCPRHNLGWHVAVTLSWCRRVIRSSWLGKPQMAELLCKKWGNDLSMMFSLRGFLSKCRQCIMIVMILMDFFRNPSVYIILNIYIYILTYHCILNLFIQYDLILFVCVFVSLWPNTSRWRSVIGNDLFQKDRYILMPLQIGTRMIGGYQAWGGWRVKKKAAMEYFRPFIGVGRKYKVTAVIYVSFQKP